MTRKLALLSTAFVAGWLWSTAPVLADAGATAAPRVEIFKAPSCGCCTKWAEHLEQTGFRIHLTEVRDLAQLKRRHGVPEDSHTCHTGIVDGYTIEGHVPADDIRRLLAERPKVTGLVVPGMPRGSPGMESPKPRPYVVYTFDESGRRQIFSRH